MGGGFDLTPGTVSRTLAPALLIAVASPAYIRGRLTPVDPTGLADLDGIVMRSLRTGRITQRQIRNADGLELPIALKQTLVVNDPAAMRAASLLGLGVTMMLSRMPCPTWSEENWWVDAGPISIYYANRTLLPSKTRVFVDFIAELFQRERYSERFARSLG
nr:LysR substrate-binding domain-containing protein [Rhizobium leguminosarum]